MIKIKYFKQSLYISLLLWCWGGGVWAQEPLSNSANTPQEQSVKSGKLPTKSSNEKTEGSTKQTSTTAVTNSKVPTAPVGPPPEPPKAEISCSPTPVPIIAPVTCVVTITHTADMTVKVTAPVGAESGDAALPQPGPDGNLVTKRRFIVRQTELDKPLRIKNVRVDWSAVGGHEGVVKLPNQKIPIKSLLLGVSEPISRDFKHPLGKKAELGSDKGQQTEAQAAFWQRHQPPALTEPNWTLIFLLAALAVSLLGIALGWVIRRWAELRARNKGPYIDPRPAHVIAYEALEILERARLIEDGAFKIYSQRLSEVLRAYFGKRFDFNGLEMTSDELREALDLQELDAESYLVLEDFLSDTDLIKFADVDTSARALAESKQQVHRLIELTKEEESSLIEETNTEVDVTDNESKHIQESDGE